jgi:Protein of unknown function (DUF3617)
MWRRALLIAVAVSMTPTTPAGAAEPAALQDGRYDVNVQLELPNVEAMGASRVATICVTSEVPGGHYGLAAMSENNPLAKCPVSNVRQDGGILTFDIICPGGNAAVASARYILTPQRFEGRISMKMGGKNMTMTETQSGRRAGDCAAGAPRP